MQKDIYSTIDKCTTSTFWQWQGQVVSFSLKHGGYYEKKTALIGGTKAFRSFLSQLGKEFTQTTVDEAIFNPDYADAFWGSYCIMAGWTMSMIPLALLYELKDVLSSLT